MRFLAALVALVTALAPQASTAPATHAAAPTAEATVETEPVGHSATAALDVALWQDPNRRRRAMVVGTDQKGPLETYDLSGRRLQRINGVYPTGVDVRDDVVVATSGRALRVYTVEPSTRRLTQRAVVPTGVTPFGVCLYRSYRTDRLYAFATTVGGRVEQWHLTLRGTRVTARSLRTWKIGTRLDACVADDSNGALYVSEQRYAIWRYRAEPDAGLGRTRVDWAKTRWSGADGKVTANAEGLAIAGDRLYVSSQGSSDFAVYHRVSNAYLGRFRVANSDDVDGCQDTVGIEATSRRLGPRFPDGALICHDGYNLDGTTVKRENYKLVPMTRAMRP
ncbi:phytase [Cryptosporangium aurantiacum]|uniref:3-phytase n=1 Tax=Cryptosporangium aurantiacum TaxID=134849 RepID=A0A1M7TV19_9ACTN|nr:phytase [Cryptosporangium aurantiacum]SHN74575.1 3-phytase [Cryptosporangium aurantiacum]